MYTLCGFQNNLKYSDYLNIQNSRNSHWIVVSQATAITLAACCAIADDIFCAVKRLETVTQLKVDKGNHC